MLNRHNNLNLSLLAGIMLAASWYWHLGILIFFAWVPLLILEQNLASAQKGPYHKLKIFFLIYLAFLVWNLLATWWIVYASVGGACMAIFANALLMTFVFLLFSKLKQRLKKPWAIWLLVPIWLAWEYGHGIWDLSWTWLNLGNVFAFHHLWVQWYEFTGVSGGALWVLAVNILVFKAVQTDRVHFLSKPIIRIAVAIVLPILFSYFLIIKYSTLNRNNNGLQTVVVQPNIDPYNFKFTLEYEAQFQKFLNLVRGKINQETNYLILPETFITDNLNEAQLNQSEQIKWFRDSLLTKFPKLKIVTGGNSYVFYENDQDATSTSRKDQQSGKKYDVFNSAFFIDQTEVKVYHKSKLVPGVERMPFPALLKPLEKLALNLGGTIGSLGTQKDRSVFIDSENKNVIAPVICYESVYADFVADYIRIGAEVIFIVTNDGWWDDTPGFIQHLNYARLRAIENRRQIARCANTGVSCFIDELGNITQPTSFWKEAVISAKMYPNKNITVFTRFGDILSYISVVVSILCVLTLIWFRFTRNATKPH